MKKLIASAALAICFGALNSFSQAACTRHVETAGGFSYCPPTGWTSKDPASGPYKTFIAAGVGSNMNVKEEATSASNSEYMASALKLLMADNDSRGEEARKLVGWSDFSTDSNIKGSRVVYEMRYKGIDMRIVQYVFDLPRRKLLLTGTRLRDVGTGDGVFDTVARSLRLTR